MAIRIVPYVDTTREFVKLIASKFELGDLSDDTVMDIGCGKEMLCARAILENFPKVKSIIALDNRSEEIQGITFQSPQIEPLHGDISKRNDIRQFEGKIDKVISTDVIHEIPNKEDAFKNVYRLLKPGGQAAFLFTSDLGLYHVLEHLRFDPRYKDYYKGSDTMVIYSSQLKPHHYNEMLEKIGFKVVEISDDNNRFPIDEFDYFVEAVDDFVAETFSVPPELVLDINNSAASIYEEKFFDQQSVYCMTKMSIFVTKPTY